MAIFLCGSVWLYVLCLVCLFDVFGGQCPLWAPGAGGERKQCDGHGAQLAQYWQMTVTAVTVVFTFHCVSVVEVPFT
ncbi:hypothetical protein A9B99_22915 [Mangrovibacter phragmitis]|uniref:Uncharacterized protein n=1 Tax=Mangrovibacter phragmitis TaxID=1691903 RepID=A0A1B7L0J2_9ENTR|nr:hypothetical protein A9B99_22915 [Mangrovibacter phragmitis]